jgi:hypothetical protein
MLGADLSGGIPFNGRNSTPRIQRRHALSANPPGVRSIQCPENAKRSLKSSSYARIRVPPI